MQKVFFILSFYFISLSSSYGQVYSLSSNSGRTIINGMSNNIVILPKEDTLQRSIGVSSGKISTINVSKFVVKDGKKMQYMDELYSWTICNEKNSIEYIYIDYTYNNKYIKSDTIFFEVIDYGFRVESGLIFTAETNNKMSELGINMLDNVKLNLNFESADVKLSNLKNITFTIEISKNGKLKKTIFNNGEALTENSKNILRKSKGKEIKLTDVKVELSCGIIVDVMDSGIYKIIE